MSENQDWYYVGEGTYVMQCWINIPYNVGTRVNEEGRHYTLPTRTLIIGVKYVLLSFRDSLFQ